MPLFKRRPPSSYFIKKKKTKGVPKMTAKQRSRANFRILRSIGAPLPEHLHTKITYSIGQIGSTTTTTIGEKIFYVNNIFDLLNNSAYAQPRYFDQLATLYQRYRVNACRYELDCAPLSGSSFFAVGFFPSTYSPPASSLKICQEDNRYRMTIASLNSGATKIRGFRSIASIEDVPKRVIRDDDSYSADVTASVTNKTQLRILWQSLDETQNYGHWIQGRLTFYTTFYQLKLPAQS